MGTVKELLRDRYQMVEGTLFERIVGTTWDAEARTIWHARRLYNSRIKGHIKWMESRKFDSATVLQKMHEHSTENDLKTVQEWLPDFCAGRNKEGISLHEILGGAFASEIESLPAAMLFVNDAIDLHILWARLGEIDVEDLVTKMLDSFGLVISDL